MDISQNIVKIKTALQMGSGILYPCEYNKYSQSFILLTNRHVVFDLVSQSSIKPTNVKSKKDVFNKQFEMLDSLEIKKMVDFSMYDRYGKIIEKSLIEDVKLFVEIESDYKIEDIAVFLISFKCDVNIELETKILWNDSDIDVIYMEGFPMILYDNDISSKMQLKGKYKEIFPKNEKIGIFQITDDYHWYSNYKDLKLFQGFSGGPVYLSDNKTNRIVGLNQSILNIGNGENPFKLLYYYKIKYVLEYLREKGCIIFNRNIDNSVSLRWIYGKKE